MTMRGLQSEGDAIRSFQFPSFFFKRFRLSGDAQFKMLTAVNKKEHKRTKTGSFHAPNESFDMMKAFHYKVFSSTL